MRAIIGFLIASVLAAASDREQEALGWIQTGMTHQQQGRYGEAERAYWNAIRIAEEDPDDWQISVAAKQNLATAYLEHGVRFSKAEDLLRGALDVLSTRLGADAPNLGALLMNLGSALMEQNRLAEAARYFQRALPKVQGDQVTVAALQSNLGILAYRQHKRSDAISHLLQAIAACDGGPEALRPLYNLGRIYLELGRNIDAETILRKAVDAAEAMGPNKPLMGSVLRSYALALRKNGRKEESRRANERSKSFSPSADYTVHVSDLGR